MSFDKYNHQSKSTKHFISPIPKVQMINASWFQPLIPDNH